MVPSNEVPGDGESVLVVRESASIVAVLRDAVSVRRVENPAGDNGAARYELDRERYLEQLLASLERSPDEAVSLAALDSIDLPVMHVTISDSLVTAIEITNELARYDEFEASGDVPDEDIELADSVTSIIQLSPIDGVALPEADEVTRFADLALSYDNAYFTDSGVSDVVGCLRFIAIAPDAKG